MELLTEEVAHPIDASVESGNNWYTYPDASGISKKPRDSRWPEWCTVSLFAALVGTTIHYHEPWADEAQAWQLSRSLPLASLFRTHIRYEGTPGLWHFLLWILIRAHVSYAGMHWFCGAIAVGAAVLLVMESPLPRYLRLLLPFTFFLLFQYAVVARSYVLAPILLFAIAMQWKKDPLRVAALLGLLANVAIHTALISAGLALVYAMDRMRTPAGTPGSRRSLLWPAAILAGLYGFAIWTAWPPRDSGYTTSSGSLPHMIIFHLVQFAHPLLVPVVFWAGVAMCLRARRRLSYLLSALFFFVFSVIVYAGWWHLGLLFPLGVSILWITWPASEVRVPRLEALGRVALVATVILQILFSVYAIQYDVRNAYSPDLATAEYIRPFVQRRAPIAVTYLDEPIGRAYRSVGLLPYFDHNIFANFSQSFWSWSSRNPAEDEFLKLLPSRPALVIVEAHRAHADQSIDLQDTKVFMLAKAGYTLTHMYCGAMPFGFETEEQSCHLVFQQKENPPLHSEPGSEGRLR